jgi:pleiotropic regulator 1
MTPTTQETITNDANSTVETTIKDVDISKYAAESAIDSYKRARVLFPSNQYIIPNIDEQIHNASIQRRQRQRQRIGDSHSEESNIHKQSNSSINDSIPAMSQQLVTIQSPPSKYDSIPNNRSNDLTLSQQQQQQQSSSLSLPSSLSSSIHVPIPKWHPPWKLSTVLSSHLGWVRSIAIDPNNRLFATGSTDSTIKIWDLPSASAGNEMNALQLTLTGHIGAVRGLAFSDRHPYLFSVGEDKTVKCWDLETNQVVRHYHGHLSGVYCLALHPTLDVLITAGRDAVARVWDMRTKTQLHVLSGHEHTIASLIVSSTHPQVCTGSHDCTVKLWDLAAGKCFTTLTHHQKSVRAMAAAPIALGERTFVSVAADSIRKWQGKNGRFLQRMPGHGNKVLNAVAIQDDGVMVTGGDDGTMNFWDYKTGYIFQKEIAKVQPGSLQQAENGILALQFDLTGTRLITGEADKSVKIWKQDENASELSHPIDMKGWKKICIAQSKERF